MVRFHHVAKALFASGRPRITSSRSNPIAVDLFADKPFVTQCPVQFILGQIPIRIPEGYHFDGASIPRILWSISGFSPLDRDTMLAALCHDWGCDHPEKIERVIADAMFITLLGPITLNDKDLFGPGLKRRTAMYIAVRAWSIIIGWRSRK